MKAQGCLQHHITPGLSCWSQPVRPALRKWRWEGQVEGQPLPHSNSKPAQATWYCIKRIKWQFMTEHSMFKDQSLIPHQKNNVKYPKRQINRQSCDYLDMQEPRRTRKWPLMDARFLLGWWKGSRTDSDSVARLCENTRSHSAIYSTQVNCTVLS